MSTSTIQTIKDVECYHDAVLENLSLNWNESLLALSAGLIEWKNIEDSRTILWSNIKELAIRREFPWGPSEHIKQIVPVVSEYTSLSYTGMRMQSGDWISVVAEGPIEEVKKNLSVADTTLPVSNIDKLVFSRAAESAFCESLIGASLCEIEYNWSHGSTLLTIISQSEMLTAKRQIEIREVCQLRCSRMNPERNDPTNTIDDVFVTSHNAGSLVHIILRFLSGDRLEITISKLKHELAT